MGKVPAGMIRLRRGTGETCEGRRTGACCAAAGRNRLRIDPFEQDAFDSTSDCVGRIAACRSTLQTHPVACSGFDDHRVRLEAAGLDRHPMQSGWNLPLTCLSRPELA